MCVCVGVLMPGKARDTSLYVQLSDLVGRVLHLVAARQIVLCPRPLEQFSSPRVVIDIANLKRRGAISDESRSDSSSAVRAMSRQAPLDTARFMRKAKPIIKNPESFRHKC